MSKNKKDEEATLVSSVNIGETQNLPVYRIVDGKRVRVKGDIRYPNKRYSHVSDGKTGEQYLREFTEEEERKRDEDEMKWEEERPLREAKRKKQEEEFKKFKQGLKYENRVVAFLDILGWGNAIKNSLEGDEKTQNLGVLLNSLRNFSQSIENTSKMTGDDRKSPGDPQITHFSDCIVLSVSAERFAEDMLLPHLSFILMSMISSGFLVRGAVTSGLLYHDGSLIYGPALIRAYKLEDKISVNPRIILDKNLEPLWKNGTAYKKKDGTLLGYKKNWRRDSDGFYFYDFLQPRFHVPGSPVNYKLLNIDLQNIKEIIMTQLGSPDPSIQSKYGWTANYLNTILDEYDGSDVEKIIY